MPYFLDNVIDREYTTLLLDTLNTKSKHTHAHLYPMAMTAAQGPPRAEQWGGPTPAQPLQGLAPQPHPPMLILIVLSPDDDSETISSPMLILIILSPGDDSKAI